MSALQNYAKFESRVADEVMSNTANIAQTNMSPS